jgi:hypothetical protein
MRQLADLQVSGSPRCHGRRKPTELTVDRNTNQHRHHETSPLSEPTSGQRTYARPAHYSDTADAHDVITETPAARRSKNTSSG